LTVYGRKKEEVISHWSLVIRKKQEARSRKQEARSKKQEVTMPNALFAQCPIPLLRPMTCLANDLFGQCPMSNFKIIKRLCKGI
jgi:hypothetical protein